MADSTRSPTASSSRARTVRGQKIIDAASQRPELPERPATVRSHTPGHLASKSHGGGTGGATSSGGSSSRRKQSEPSMRQRSQSVATKTNYPPQSVPTPVPTFTVRRNDNYQNDATASSADAKDAESRRPLPSRSASSMSVKPSSLAMSNTAQARKPPPSTRPPRGTYTAVPALQDPATAADVPAAPSSGMYWSRAPVSGAPHKPLRAHTTTLVGSNVFVFGGCDSRACFNDLYVLDADSFHWSTPVVAGEVPLPLRAMTCTAVGKKLVVFGGGDGPAYYNDVYVLDTMSYKWHKPRIVGDQTPSARRAHTACLYKNGIYVFGGGDGVRALNDIWRLDVSDIHKMSWRLISGSDSSPRSGSPGGGSRLGGGVSKPQARGYHTANMVGSKLIIYGGSDGGECFNDVWVYDVETRIWKSVQMPIPFRRLSHTSTLVGSYLFIIGGHDGSEYSNDVLLLNLVTMSWDKRRVYGLPPTGRGYHGTVLYDSRLLMIGGFDGADIFGDVWILELAVHAYYSQISHFTIEV
ncbi:galactose oxidase [Xylariaceae sp. FL1272]|nr:galactose oxidase [Xylariaceae sp. FL1272]